MEPSPGQQSSLVNLSIFLFSCLQFFITSSRASPSACYYATNGTVYESPDYVVPCGNGSATVSSPQSCCDLSANNKCLSAGLCYDPNVLDGSYYTSPCTDPTYGASECPQYCSNRVDKNQLDVIYDPNDKIWRCCSTNPNGDSNCSSPTDETFNALPPQDLTELYPTSTINAAGSSSNTQSSSTSPTSTTTSNTPTALVFTAASVTPSSTSSTSEPDRSVLPSQKSLSDGAKVGIGVGVGVGVGVPVVLLVVYLLYKCHHRKLRANSSGNLALKDYPKRDTQHRDHSQTGGSPTPPANGSVVGSLTPTPPASLRLPGFDRQPPAGGGESLRL